MRRVLIFPAAAVVILGGLVLLAIVGAGVLLGAVTRAQ